MSGSSVVVQLDPDSGCDLSMAARAAAAALIVRWSSCRTCCNCFRKCSDSARSLELSIMAFASMLAKGNRRAQSSGVVPARAEVLQGARGGFVKSLMADVLPSIDGRSTGRDLKAQPRDIDNP